MCRRQQFKKKEEADVRTYVLGTRQEYVLFKCNGSDYEGKVRVREF